MCLNDVRELRSACMMSVRVDGAGGNQLGHPMYAMIIFNTFVLNGSTLLSCSTCISGENDTLITECACMYLFVLLCSVYIAVRESI